jgi:hypothetical protein
MPVGAGGARAVGATRNGRRSSPRRGAARHPGSPAHDLTLVTHNLREFSRVAGLKIEDWEDARQSER